MSKGPPHQPVDIEELLERIHGRTEEARRDDQVNDALKAIETTHRAASMAVRNFERTGRLEAEANVLAALGALADDTNAPAEPAPAAEKTTAYASATRSGAPATTEVTRTQVAQAPPSETNKTAGPAPRVTGAEVTAAFVKAPPFAEGSPSVSPAEKTQAYVPTPLAQDEKGRAPHTPLEEEVTRTFSIEEAPAQGDAPQTASAKASPARTDGAPETEDPRLKPQRVFSGQGKQMPAREVTRTNIIRRPKK